MTSRLQGRHLWYWAKSPAAFTVYVHFYFGKTQKSHSHISIESGELGHAIILPPACVFHWMTQSINNHCIFITSCEDTLQRWLTELREKEGWNKCIWSEGEYFEVINSSMSYIIINVLNIHSIWWSPLIF